MHLYIVGPSKLYCIAVRYTKVYKVVTKVYKVLVD